MLLNQAKDCAWSGSKPYVKVISRRNFKKYVMCKHRSFFTCKITFFQKIRDTICIKIWPDNNSGVQTVCKGLYQQWASRYWNSILSRTQNNWVRDSVYMWDHRLCGLQIQGSRVWSRNGPLLSFTSESMCTKYWLISKSSLPRKKSSSVTQAWPIPYPLHSNAVGTERVTPGLSWLCELTVSTWP